MGEIRKGLAEKDLHGRLWVLTSTMIMMYNEFRAIGNKRKELPDEALFHVYPAGSYALSVCWNLRSNLEANELFSGLGYVQHGVSGGN